MVQGNFFGEIAVPTGASRTADVVAQVELISQSIRHYSMGQQVAEAHCRLVGTVTRILKWTKRKWSTKGSSSV